MAGISSPGIGSGLNVQSLVSQLVAAERQPAQDQIDAQRTKVQTQLSALGSLKSALSNLQSSLSSLADGSVFDKRTATSSDTDVFDASADAKAVAGTYSIEVVNLASAQKLSSGAFSDADTAVGTGTLTLSVGDKSIDLDIDSEHNTLADIRDAINGAKDNPGVSAAIVHAGDGAHLVLTSTATGLEGAASISASGGDGGLAALDYDASAGTGSLNVVTAAQDATIKVDGFAVSRSSNTIDDAIDGITIDLAKANPGATETLTVGRDTDAASKAINAFVSTYNNFIKSAKNLSSYDADNQTAGPLLGDSTLLGVRSQLASAIGSMVGDSGAALRTLGDLGVSFQTDGTLAVDDDKLATALDTAPDTVKGLFSGDNGYGSKLNTLLDGYLDSDNGVLSIRTDSLNQRSKDLDDRESNLDARMSDVQNRYMKQFTALDTMMATMQSTSDFLTQQLASISSTSSSGKSKS